MSPSRNAKTLPGSRLTITLIHKNCPKHCNICAYGPAEPVDYYEIERVVDVLMDQGCRVHLYDFEVNRDSVAMFRRTRQFERPNPGWLNVTWDFDAVVGFLENYHSRFRLPLGIACGIRAGSKSTS